MAVPFKADITTIQGEHFNLASVDIQYIGG